VVDTTNPVVADDGYCSLVEAITNANGDAAVCADCPAGSGPDIVELGQKATYTLVEVNNTAVGPNGLPVVTSQILINGHDSTILRDIGAPVFRIFSVGTTGNLELVDLAIRNGNPGGTYFGGAVYNHGGTTQLVRTEIMENTSQCGGGLHNRSGTMTVLDSVISQNAGYYGGGICTNAKWADALLVIENTLITDNISTSEGGGIQSVREEALGWMSTVHVTGSTVSHNSSGAFSGGITSEGDITLVDSTISGNHTGDAAGGLYVVRGTATIKRSTITGNTVETTADIGGAGGGVLVNDATATISNSTISGNHALGAATSGEYSGRGGGVYLAGYGADTVVTIEDSTICDNTADVTGGGIAVQRLGGTDPIEVTLRNTVVAANLDHGAALPGNCSEELGATVKSENFNLADDLTCNLFDPDDLVVADVMLGPLAAYGGPTLSHRPMPGSPAIDSGDDALCPDTDQRGNLRPWDGDGDGVVHCDRGAIEFGAPHFYDGFESGDTAGWSAAVP
jgi:hypothetical protein